MIIITLGGKLLNWINSSLISPCTFPFTAVTMLLSGLGCVDHTFFLRPVSSIQTQPESLLFFVYLPLFPWCLFPNRNAAWNYSEWSHWISLFARITVWKAEEGAAVQTQRPTLMYENEQRLMCWFRDKCVPTDINMFLYVSECRVRNYQWVESNTRWISLLLLSGYMWLH